MPGELAYALYAKGDTVAPVGIVNTGSEQFARAGTTLATRRWQYLTTTYDGTMSRLYLNGALLSTTRAPGAVLTSNGTLDIGGNNVWSEWFKGSIDDVRIYNRALSSSEIGSDMNTAVTQTATPLRRPRQRRRPQGHDAAERPEWTSDVWRLREPGHTELEHVDRRHGCRRLRRVPERRRPRLVSLDELHVHRPAVRHELLARC